MKIITPGALAAETIYRCKCTACHTLYEFQRKEGTFKSGGQREGDCIVTKCPMKGCAHENWTDVITYQGSQWDR